MLRAHSLSPLRLITKLIADTGAVNAMYFDAVYEEELCSREREKERGARDYHN